VITYFLYFLSCSPEYTMYLLLGTALSEYPKYYKYI